MMFGKAKEKVIVGDGDYVSIEEIAKAIQDALENEGEGAFIVDSKGKKAEIEDVINAISKVSDKIVVREKSEKITNQDTRTWDTKTKEQKKEKNSGVAFLGNNGIELPCGEYVNEADMIAALEQYRIEPPAPPTPIPGPEEQHKVVKVTKLDKFKAKAVILATVAMVIASGFTKVPVTAQTIETEPAGTANITRYVQEISENLGWSIDEVVDTESIVEEAIKSQINAMQMGQDIYVKDGVEYYDSATKEGNHKAFGESSHKGNQEYAITGFAATYTDSHGNTHLIDYIENFNNDANSAEYGCTLEEFMNSEAISEACEKYGISKDDLQIMVHTGENGKKRNGWSDVKDLINENEIINSISSQGATVRGVSPIENGVAVINVDGQEVSINVNDVKPGDKITVNGKEYEIGTLDITNEVTDKAITEKDKEVSPEQTKTSETVEGYELNWNLKNCNAEIGLIGAAIAGLIKTAQKMKNDKNRKNALFFDFNSQEEMDEFLQNIFEGNEQESKESIASMLKRWFISEKKGNVQEFSKEQIEELTNIVLSDMGRTQDDYILTTTPEGKVVVVTSDYHEKSEKVEEISQETREKISGIEGKKIAEEPLSKQGEELFEESDNKGILSKLKGMYKKSREIPAIKRKEAISRIREDATGKANIQGLKEVGGEGR